MTPLSAISLPEAIHALSVGRVVAFPTGTSYGLAADIAQGFALQRVRNLKKRPQDKTFTVFMNDSLWDEYLVLNRTSRTYLERLNGHPVTVLIKSKPNLAHLAQDGLVGVRLIDHPLMRDLAAGFSYPLTATSANPSGADPCLSTDCLCQTFPREVADHVYDLSLAGYIDGGTLASSQSSTIIRPEKSGYTIVREGALPGQEIDRLLA